MVPFAEFPRNPDDRCYTLMRSLMIAGTARYLQVRVAVEPDLLEKTNEVRDFLSGVQVASDVQRSEFQNALLAKLRFGSNRGLVVDLKFQGSCPPGEPERVPHIVVQTLSSDQCLFLVSDVNQHLRFAFFQVDLQSVGTVFQTRC